MNPPNPIPPSDQLAELPRLPRDEGGPIFAEPIVVNGRVFAGAWDQRLHAYGLDE